MYQNVATITAFDEGYAVEWGNRHIAVKTERDLARVIKREAQGLRFGRDGGSETIGRVIQFPSPLPGDGVTPLYDLPPDEQVRHARQNLDRLAEGWVTGQIDAEMFENLLAGACPGMTGDDVQAAIERAQAAQAPEMDEDEEEGGDAV